MPTELTITAKTATTVTLAVSNVPVGGIQLVIADNPRFDGIAPFKTYTQAAANAGIVVNGLNQGGTYYMKARGQQALGVFEGWGKTVGVYTPVAAAWNTAPAGIMVDPAFVVLPEPILAYTPPGGEQAGYPVSNLFNDDPSLMFMSTGGAFYVETAGAPIDTIALLDTNFAENVTWFVAGGNTQAEAAGAAPFSFGSVAFRVSPNLPQRRGYHGLIRLPAPQAYKHWRIQLTAGSTALDIIMARYLVMGRARYAKNIAADKLESPLDLGSIDRGRDGTADRVYGHRMRKVDFEISMLTEMQWETQFGDLWQKIGLNEPCLVVPNAKAGAFLHDRILYGTLAAQRGTNHVAPRFSQAFSVESLI